jgi:immune inhibitor A
LKEPTTRLVVILVTLLTALLACFCLAAGGAVGAIRLLTQKVPTPAATAVWSETTVPAATLDIQPLDPTALDTLKIIAASRPEPNDPYELARRLANKQNIPTTLPEQAVSPKVGDEQLFWVSNSDTHEYRQVPAVLRYTGAHLYFWVEKGVEYRDADISRLVKAFDEQIYPATRALFGSEWTPGVDNDPRMYLVYANNLGKKLAGYYSSYDEYNPEVYPYSNGHELFLVDAGNVSLSKDYILSTMAHELQHAIQWNIDRNEEAWLNEGFSMLAEFTNHYYNSGFDYTYSLNTNLPLTGWSPISGDNGPHYGASFLFVQYFLSRFGEPALKALVANPLNGLASVDDVLESEGITDPLTGRPTTAEDVFADWAAANYLGNSTIGDGRYGYANFPQAPKSRPALRISSCPSIEQTRSVSQYGTEAILISCPGQHQLEFQGSTEVNLLSSGAYFGNYAFWSNQGDYGDMTLTRSFDLTQVSAPISLEYHTWYQMEKDFDFVYLEASLDGQSWQIINTPSCTADELSGSSYGCGYNGDSEGWIEEKVDLSLFAGKQVQLRFEYVTDAAVNGEGFLLDDISVPTIGYFADFETDDGGWEAVNFLRVTNRLPQTYRLTLILQGDQTTVQNVPLDEHQRASIPLNLGVGIKEAVLLVSGTTRYTSLPAVYQFSINP